MDYKIADRGRFKMISISGDIDSEESRKALDEEISRLMGEGNHHFVFNLERTTYLDSAGISVFIHCLCDVQENNGSVYIIAGDSQVKEVLELVGLNQLIKTYTTERDFVGDQKVEGV